MTRSGSETTLTKAPTGVADLDAPTLGLPTAA